jgi:hypothetical protein
LRKRRHTKGSASVWMSVNKERMWEEILMCVYTVFVVQWGVDQFVRDIRFLCVRVWGDCKFSSTHSMQRVEIASYSKSKSTATIIMIINERNEIVNTKKTRVKPNQYTHLTKWMRLYYRMIHYFFDFRDCNEFGIKFDLNWS